MKIIVENGVLLDVEVDYEKDDGAKEFTIPDGVVRLENESLAHLPWRVETLYIPSSVEEISEGAFLLLGGGKIISKKGSPAIEYAK